MKVDGACACGAIRIEAEADPERTQVCHCTDCQTATGTAFRVSLGVLRQRDQLTPRRQIWWRSSRPWVAQLDALPKHEKQG